MISKSVHHICTTTGVITVSVKKASAAKMCGFLKICGAVINRKIQSISFLNDNTLYNTHRKIGKKLKRAFYYTVL